MDQNMSQLQATNMTNTTNATNAIDRPLAGIKVLDLSRLLPGPIATLRLQQLGAQVLKIEQPGAGDYARLMGPIKNKVSQFYVAVNQDKDLLRLDLKNPEHHAQLLELVKSADVLLESFRPGVMDKLGLGWEQLRAVNPKLVMCAISGFGKDGPYAELAGHDLNFIALSGMLEQNCGPDGVPAIPNLQVGDMLGGAQQAITGILAALLAVKMGGPGRFVEVSMADGVLTHNLMPRVAVNGVGHTAAAARDLLTGGVPCYNVYRTSDGRFMAVGALELKFWELVCDVLQRPDLRDKHWNCGQQIDGEEARMVKAELDRIFAGKSFAEWTALFTPVDCCVSPVLTAAEALHHPLFQERGMVFTAQHESEGEFLQTGPGIRFFA